ncbi:adhesion G-protein coupled receptor G1 [Anolis carolinensis]|uniref:adhesion G-protein coupled receptor G1 n=1 Tax=Anolis carolinensis TaxID=28377 RepID=UPI002F2B36C0
MFFLLLPLLFQFPGVCGNDTNQEDFRFCADRNQTDSGSVHYGTQKDLIRIVNRVDRLDISAPFPPEDPLGSQKWELPARPGIYRFCVFWFQEARLFRLRYGSTDFALSARAEFSLYLPLVSGKPNESSTCPLYNVSYAHSKGSHNVSLASASIYSFTFEDSGKLDPKEAEKELRRTEEALKKLEDALRAPVQGRTPKRGNPFAYLLNLESKLGGMEFPGENKTLGAGSLLNASVWKIQTPKDLHIRSELEEGEEASGFEVTLPKFVFERRRRGRRSGNTKVVTLSARSQMLFQGRDANQILGGKVIGVSVGNTPVHDLPREERVAITFFHKPLPGNVTPQCVFWDTEAGQSGNWSTLGCEASLGSNQTTCLCDHLTFFAVMMVSSPDIDHVHHTYLTLITYVGCIISAVASFFTIFSFLCSRKRQRDHIVYVHMNLLWAIFILDMSFLIAVPLAPNAGDTSCKAGAMFLHFSLLACLTWMGLEGYCLYQLVIEVFHSYVKNFLLKLCLVGWGLPIIMVSLVFLIDQSHYGPFSLEVYDSAKGPTNATICWVTKKEINHFLNLGLLSLVLFFNGLMLAAMVREILRLRHREHHWEYAVMLLGLSCVLGIPWGLAFFAFSSGTFRLVAVYLFTIINSFQGFLIFLWYLAKVLQSRRSSSMQCSTSNSIKLQSSSTSI